MFIEANKGKYWKNMSEMLGELGCRLWRTEIIAEADWKINQKKGFAGLE